MARVSFSLRRLETDLGSYTQFDSSQSYRTSGPGGTAGSVGSRTDVDYALRADDLQQAPVSGAAITSSFFEVLSSCYGEVTLNWGVPIVPIESLGATPDVTGMVLVYSPNGEPQTISSGKVLVESSEETSFTQQDLPEGKWAYYSLFLHYEDIGGSSFYERAASLSVLVPKDYGSTMQLWKRVPEYYRIQDAAQGSAVPLTETCFGSYLPADRVVGPLFKYLSIVGFDIDRMRTLIDNVMVSRDPREANSEALEAIAEQVNSLLKVSDLGSARLRSVLDNLGFYRRNKGTEEAIKLIVRAIAGSDIEIDKENYTVKILSQRANYITDPKDGTGIVLHRPAGDVEQAVGDALPFYDTTYSGYSDSYINTGTEFVSTGTGSVDGVNSVMIRINSPIPVSSDDYVGFSVNSNIGVSAIRWARVVSSGGNVLGVSTSSTVGSTKSFYIDITEAVDILIDGYIEILVDLSDVPVFDISLMIAERNNIGEYFDGDVVKGGWLVDTTSVSDYRWAGSANSSISLYAEEYERTKGILQSVLLDGTFPITEVDRYEISSFNTTVGSFSPVELSPTLWLDASDVSTITLEDAALLDGTGLSLPGTSGNYARTPTSAALNITGDIELVVRVSLDDWTPSASKAFIGKGFGNSYNFGLTSTGQLSFTVNVGGSIVFANLAFSAPADGTTLWLKVTRDATAGTVTFYQATDQASEPGSWTTLGTAATTAGNLTTTAQPLGIGAAGAGYLPMAGMMYRAIVRDGIGGTVAFDADFAAEEAGTTSFTEDSVNAATVSLMTTYGRVSQWDDKSGNGNHVTQGTAENQPTTYYNTIVGKNVLTFSDAYVSAPLSIDVDGVTTFTVFRESTSVTNAGVLVLTPSSGNDYQSTSGIVHETGVGGEAVFQAIRYLLGSSPNQIGISKIEGTKPSPLDVYCGRFSQSGLVESFSSGLSATSTTSSASFGASSEVLIGARYTGGAVSGSNKLLGDVAEVLVYSRALSNDELNQVGEYLANKWGLTWVPK